MQALSNNSGSGSRDGGDHRSIGRRVWDWFFNPTSRLSPDFPLTGSKLGKAYAVATFVFFVGSFLPGLLLVGFVLGLVLFADQANAARYINVLMDATTGEFRPTPLAILMLVSFLSGFVPQTMYLAKVLKRNGGRSMKEVLGLTFTSLRGRTCLHTAWAVAWRSIGASLVVFAFTELVGHFLKGPEQPTVELMRKASGSNLVLWFITAAILAPIFEEVVFRGFLFQALRSTFYEWLNPETEKKETAVEVVEEKKKPAGKLSWLAGWIGFILLLPLHVVGFFVMPVLRFIAWVLSPVTSRLAAVGACVRVRLGIWGQSFARWFGTRVLKTKGRADFAAVIISALLFAVEHMQFQPVTLLMLFLMGCFLAEIFRRTGTLWTGIILHAINNGVYVILIALSVA